MLESTQQNAALIGKLEPSGEIGLVSPKATSSSTQHSSIDLYGTPGSTTKFDVWYSSSGSTNHLYYWDYQKREYVYICGNGMPNGTSKRYTVNNLAPGDYTFVAAAYRSGQWYDAALFVTVPLPPESLVTYTKSNMIFKIDQTFIDILGSARTTRFTDKNNAAYSSMYGLVGGAKPFSGAKMEMHWTRTLPWDIDAIAGQPIKINTGNFLAHAYAMVAQNTDMTQGPIHEIGHNFDSHKWVFEGEATANILVYYYFLTTGEKMALAGRNRYFQGADYKIYLKSYAGDISYKCYDESIPYGIYSPFALTYRFACIMDEIGTLPFKKTYAYFSSLQPYEVPPTSLGKLNLFIEKLRDYSDVDVLSMFTSQEKAVFGTKFGGTLAYPKVGIILIHGLGGSNMKVSGQYVWDPPKTFVEQKLDFSAMNNQIRKLFMYENGQPVNNGVSVVANETAFFDPFATLKTNLTTKFSGKYSVDLFTYDWRQSNITTANQLQSHIALKGYQYVYLVAHSMGGLVSSQFMKNDANRAKVRRLITVGTPYSGAASTLYAMETGEKSEFWSDVATSAEVMKELYINMPSMYQLYPTSRHPDYVIRNGATLSYSTAMNFIRTRPFALIGGTGAVKAMFSAGTSFQSGLMIGGEQIAEYYGKVDYIVGYTHNTINKVQYNTLNGNVTALDISSGDGTVLISSASNDKTSSVSNPADNVYFYTASHTGLLKNASVITKIGNLIIAASKGTTAAYAPPNPNLPTSESNFLITARGWASDEDGRRIMFITDGIGEVRFADSTGFGIVTRGNALVSTSSGEEVGTIFPLDVNGKRVQYVLNRDVYSVALEEIREAAEIKVQYTDFGYFDISETYFDLDDFEAVTVQLDSSEKIRFYSEAEEFFPAKMEDNLEEMNTDNLKDILSDDLYDELVRSNSQFHCVFTENLQDIGFERESTKLEVTKVVESIENGIPDVIAIQTRKNGMMYLVKDLDTLDIVTDDASNITVTEVVQGRIVPSNEAYVVAENRTAIS